MVKISITGKNPSFFIKTYIFNKINYKKYKVINHNKVELIISYNDYIKIKNIKSIYDITIIKMYGLYKYVYLMKEYYMLFITFIISFLFLLLISNTIFDIDIMHNNSAIRNLVKDSLKEEKIEALRLIPNYNKRKKIIEKIVNENKDKLEWLEIERKGSKLIIKVVERKINNAKEDNNPRHIIARKSGIITKIDASSGVILKQKNDYVEKGEIIISGDIVKDETVKGRVKASGNVYAETWYKVKVVYPLNYKEVKYLDDVKNNIVIHFLNKDINIRPNYVKNYIEDKKTLIKSKVVTFSIRMEKQRKIKVIDKKYTKNKALLLATSLAEEKIKKKLHNDEFIISKKTLNLREFNSRIEVDVFFKVNENITNYLDITELDENTNKR